MYKHLYENFSHWCINGSVWLYSDPHFADDETNYLLRKDYVGDEEQIKRINGKVGKYDTLIILGDIGPGQKALDCISRLRGYKVLLMGNHEAGINNYKSLFNEVYEGPLFISEKILLSHEPIDFPFALNIHGHDHSNWFSGSNHINMCAENINYTPVCLKTIINSGVLKNIISLHRVTIDKATNKN